MANCKKCGRHIKFKYANETGLCFNCYKITNQQNQSGGNKIAFKTNKFNTTEHHEPKGALTGKKDAMFLRNQYQTEIDNAHTALVNMVHYLESKNTDLKSAYNYAQGQKRDVQSHETERANLYETLGNMLTKETNFEKTMWQSTIKNQKINKLTIKQKFKDSDIDEIKYNSMQEYLKQYPEYASKSSFKTVLGNIEKKEKDIRECKQNYNNAVSKYNFLHSDIENHIIKATHNLKSYKDILKEGKVKLSDTRYNKSIFFKFASEETKSKVTLNTLQHRADKFEEVLETIKKGLTKNEDKTFKEMDY